MGKYDMDIILVSSDGVEFEVDALDLMPSQTIKNMLENSLVDGGIPLPNVTSIILAKVIEYCKKHANYYALSSHELKSWDAEFISVDQATLFDLILAADYLDIQGLLDLACQAVADIMKGKTTEEIRKTFHIENDISPEEEEDLRRETDWAFK